MIFPILHNALKGTTQSSITCSKSTIETLEQRCKICSKLTIKPPKRRHWRRFGIFIVNFEHISHLCSAILLLTLSSKCWLGMRLIRVFHKNVKYLKNMGEKENNNLKINLTYVTPNVPFRYPLENIKKANIF